MSFEEYVARERVKNHAAETNRYCAGHGRIPPPLMIAAIFILLILLVSVLSMPDSMAADQEAPQIVPTVPERGSIPATTYASVEAMEKDGEDIEVEPSLLDGARVIEECEVTWYTADTCGKAPGDPAYGITASGLPVEEHLTCATDPDVIPMYSAVFVQYLNGDIEQLLATDTGVTGDCLDIYIADYGEAIQNGRQTLKVWFIPPEELP